MSYLMSVEQAFDAARNGQLKPFTSLIDSKTVATSAKHPKEAASKGQDQIVKYLMLQARPHPNVNGTSLLGRETALHLAVRADHLVVVKTLLRVGANVNAENKCGWTPLHYVKSVNVARALIESGANPSARDRQGRTPTQVVEIYISEGDAEPGTSRVLEDAVLHVICDREERKMQASKEWREQAREYAQEQRAQFKESVADKHRASYKKWRQKKNKQPLASTSTSTTNKIAAKTSAK